MTAYHGKSAALWLANADISPYFTDIGFSADVEAADTTTFGSTWKSAIAGVGSAKVDAKGLYDPTITSLTSILADAGDVLTVGPVGLALGASARLLRIITSAYAESSPVGGLVSIAWGAQCDGTVGMGKTLHAMSLDTNTTTGADTDDLTATTAGWVAHLHVNAVSAGSWVVKLQDAATNDWADVASAAFTAATGPTNQRLTGTGTLRRHVRYIATRTGGTASDTILFGLAYARL
jgi:hypothetical protein